MTRVTALRSLSPRLITGALAVALVTMTGCAVKPSKTVSGAGTGAAAGAVIDHLVDGRRAEVLARIAVLLGALVATQVGVSDDEV